MRRGVSQTAITAEPECLDGSRRSARRGQPAGDRRLGVVWSPLASTMSVGGQPPDTRGARVEIGQRSPTLHRNEDGLVSVVGEVLRVHGPGRASTPTACP